MFIAKDSSELGTGSLNFVFPHFEFETPRTLSRLTFFLLVQAFSSEEPESTRLGRIGAQVSDSIESKMVSSVLTSLVVFFCDCRALKLAFCSCSEEAVLLARLWLLPRDLSDGLRIGWTGAPMDDVDSFNGSPLALADMVRPCSWSSSGKNLIALAALELELVLKKSSVQVGVVGIDDRLPCRLLPVLDVFEFIPVGHIGIPYLSTGTEPE